jgi:hypothetical protein
VLTWEWLVMAMLSAFNSNNNVFIRWFGGCWCRVGVVVQGDVVEFGSGTIGVWLMMCA